MPKRGKIATKMYFTQDLLVLLLLGIVLTFPSCEGEAKKPCTEDGWFGPDCKYMCHCADDEPCDKVNGFCSSGCHTNYTGPACQYYRVRFTASGDMGWLTDVNDATCNPGFSSYVNVSTEMELPLSWVRVVVNDAAFLNTIQLQYQLSDHESFQSCKKLQTAKVDDVTLDIFCPRDDTVKSVSLHGAGVKGLCSIYISGGRNVALKQRANQASQYVYTEAPNSFLAKNAVDGRHDAPIVNISAYTCTHTSEDGDDEWGVTFSPFVDIYWVTLYNRQDCCDWRLKGFMLTIYPALKIDRRSYFRHQDRRPIQRVYTVVPEPKIKYPVQRITVHASSENKFLTVCEFYAYGEVICEKGKFGRDCERDCNCLYGTDCLVHSGGCPAGCAENYAGEDCLSEFSSET